ncbi:hypothetical protein Hanom_Chr08g00687121 [Helianthus anomalus]
MGQTQRPVSRLNHLNSFPSHIIRLTRPVDTATKTTTAAFIPLVFPRLLFPSLALFETELFFSPIFFSSSKLTPTLPLSIVSLEASLASKSSPTACFDALSAATAGANGGTAVDQTFDAIER